MTLPAVYFEKNLWAELEHSIDLWSQPTRLVELTPWPQVPDGPGICLFAGPVRNLEKLPGEIHIDSLICLPPRPNQAFWTLSALWTAWLWGRDAQNRFNQVLGRRRFDWHWHTQALTQAFKKAASLAAHPVKAFTQISELSSGMIFATIAASHFAGFCLEGLAMNSPEAPVQSMWQTGQKEVQPSKANPQSIAREAIRSVLLSLGEPASYAILYMAVISELADHNCLPVNIKEFTQEKKHGIAGVGSQIVCR